MSRDCIPERLSSVAHYLAKTGKEAENTIISTNKKSNTEK